MKNLKKILFLFTCLTLLLNIKAGIYTDTPASYSILEEDVYEN